MSNANPTPLYIKAAIFDGIMKHDKEMEAAFQKSEMRLCDLHERNRTAFPAKALQMIDQMIADACKQWDEDMKKGEQQ